MSDPSVFQVWQPKYAARGFATFPVKFVARGDKLDKVPAVKHYLKLGLRASTELTRRFADADGVGIILGARSGLAVADIDTTDENAIADVLAHHGPSPLIARSPSGGHHVYYRHNSRQRRRVRDPYWLERGIPVDMLGNGFIVAPASRSPKGTYCFVQGDLDDLQRLPFMRLATPRIEPTAAAPAPAAQPIVPAGHRNDQLFRHCMRWAKNAQTFSDLLDVARCFNTEHCVPPLGEEEVMNTAQSAWKYTEQDLNRFGRQGAWIAAEEIDCMACDQDAFFLLAFLRRYNGPWATFMCTNTLAAKLGWTRYRLTEGRRRLIELGLLRRVRSAGKGQPALYRWC